MRREKTVSVRFAAVGGDATKAEMRSVGRSGKDAMQDIAGGAGHASAGLDTVSATAQRARAQLEAIAAKAAASAAQMRSTAAATTEMQARINRMTGVSPSGGMSAAEALQQGQVLDDLRAKYSPLYAEIRRYRQALSELRVAESEGAITTQEASAAKARLRSASLAAIDGIKGISAAHREQARAADEAARSEAMLSRELDDLRARYNPVYAATRAYRDSLADLNRLKAAGVITSDEYSAALGREADRMRMAIIAQSAAAQQVARHASGAAMRMQQMSFQLNDIGVSLAGGMNPFVVMAQQGTQIAQIYGFGQGGVGQAMRDVGGMMRGIVTRFPALTVAVGTFTGAILGMRHEINQAKNVQVSFGDTALAVFQVIGRGIAKWIKPATDKISEWFDWAWDKVIVGVKWVGNGIINGIRIAVSGVKTAVGTIPDMFLSAFNMAVSHVMTKMHDMVWYVAQAINSVAGGLNDVFGTNFSTTNMSGVLDALNKGSGVYFKKSEEAGARIAGAWDEFANGASATWNDDPMGDFYSAVRKQAIRNSRDRKKKKGGSGSEKDEVADLVKALQQELAVLRETDPVKKKMLEYADKLADATAAERTQVLGLVKTLDAAKNGWEAVGRSLSEYAEAAKRIGGDIGDALTGAFSSAEDAMADFVKTGKFSFKDLVTSILADITRITVRNNITGPLAGLLGNALSKIGLGGSGGGLGLPSFDGGGYTGDGPRSGGLDGKGGFLAVMHSRERVDDLTRGQGANKVVVEVVGGNMMLTDGGQIMAQVDVRVRQGSQATSAQVTRNLRTQPKALTGLA